jgi:NAD(P)-dependent dehydrogenase (short-subunit alcohol dehydrogenase family)
LPLLIADDQAGVVSWSIDPMSTVLIIGASRGIGLETVKLALKAGHSVRAIARSAGAMRLRDPRLEKMDGDALG